MIFYHESPPLIMLVFKSHQHHISSVYTRIHCNLDCIRIKNPAFNSLILHNNISTTVHATTELFVLFFLTQDGESADMNCLVFWAHCENG